VRRSSRRAAYRPSSCFLRQVRRCAMRRSNRPAAALASRSSHNAWRFGGCASWRARVRSSVAAPLPESGGKP
jgi:hypothetical protein